MTLLVDSGQWGYFVDANLVSTIEHCLLVRNFDTRLVFTLTAGVPAGSLNGKLVGSRLTQNKIQLLIVSRGSWAWKPSPLVFGGTG